jgi:hypothetical protein
MFGSFPNVNLCHPSQERLESDSATTITGQPAISPFGDIGRCDYSCILLKSHSNEKLSPQLALLSVRQRKSEGKPVNTPGKAKYFVRFSVSHAYLKCSVLNSRHALIQTVLRSNITDDYNKKSRKNTSILPKHLFSILVKRVNLLSTHHCNPK